MNAERNFRRARLALFMIAATTKPLEQLSHNRNVFLALAAAPCAFRRPKRSTSKRAEAIRDDPKTVFDHYAWYAPEDLREVLEREWVTLCGPIPQHQALIGLVSF
jgi:hypothetical protein